MRPETLAELERLHTGHGCDEEKLLAYIRDLEAALEQACDWLGGWREVVCEIEDMGPPEHLAKAMYAVIDQMDKFREQAAAALGGSR